MQAYSEVQSEFQAGTISPLQIIDAQQKRLFNRYTFQQCRDSIEQAKLLLFGRKYLRYNRNAELFGKFREQTSQSRYHRHAG